MQAWLTVGIVLATALGVLRLMRALGAVGVLLPFALALGASAALSLRIASAGPALEFVLEPLALCLLVWCYDAFTRGHTVGAAVLLGGAGLAHPIAFAHGLLALAIATLFTGEWRSRKLGIALAIALAAGAPAALQLGIAGLDLARLGADDAARLIADGYRFRYPNLYTLQGLPGEAGLRRLVVLFAGLGAALALRWGAFDRAARRVLGLIVGQALLSALAAVCYTRRLPGPWSRSAAAYALDLTLTSPILGLLCGAALAAVVEARVRRGTHGLTGRPALQGVLWVAAAVLALTTDWTVLWRSVRYQEPAAGVDRATSELYAWVRGTPKRSSFIVPPSATQFRYYTRKGVYVDYDLVPPASPHAMRVWRERIDRVSAADPRVATAPAWRRPYAIDRAYAVANTPARIADLLDELGESYLVWDARGLDIPPHLPVERSLDPRVVEAFSNDRYVVYALRSRSADAH
jgi:hypothetical protein